MSNLKKIEGGVTTPQGFTAGAVYTAIKKRENKKPDVAVLYSDLPCSCAACFTTNKFCAAPVILDREILKKGKARAVVINSGNANAATGKQGIEDARTVEREAEKLLGLGEDEVFVCSTGVIGQRLPVDKVLQGIREIIPGKLAKENGSEAAYAIMTTDTVRKECAYELQLSTGTVKIGAMAKGSGMIHPNMATMLVYVTTDAKADPADLQKMLSAAVDKSFNMCTVDGDTSTNDSIFLLANGASGVEIKTEEDKKAMADLVLAMQTIMERGEKLAAPPSAALSEIVRREPYPVKGKAEEILHRLKEFGMTRFKLLFRGSRSRSEIVATFIAVLELCREKVIHLAGSDTDCTVECGDDAPDRINL